jgi:hypothetical protein
MFPRLINPDAQNGLLSQQPNAPSPKPNGFDPVKTDAAQAGSRHFWDKRESRRSPATDSGGVAGGGGDVVVGCGQAGGDGQASPNLGGGLEAA